MNDCMIAKLFDCQAYVYDQNNCPILSFKE